MKFLKEKRWILSVIGSFLTFTLIFSGCSAKKEEAKKYRNVKIMNISNQVYDKTQGVSGNIVPVETVKVSFKINGVVEEIYIKEGQSVKKGDPIAKIKSDDYNLAVKASKAAYDSASMSISKDIPNKIEQAKAQLDLTQVNYERVKALYEEGAVSKAQLDEITAKLTVDKSTLSQAQDAVDIASTQLGQAKAGYDLALNNLKETTIYSPVDGIVLKKLSSSGEVQGAGYPVAIIGSKNQMWAEFPVTDEEIGKFKQGQKQAVYIYGLEKTQVGEISEVGALADEKTRLFTVKVKLDNSKGDLKAGMVAKALLNKSKSDRIMIPFLSVVHLSDGEVVYLYDEKTSRVREQKIKTGDLIDDRVEVLEGISVEDKLVIEGQYQVRDKEKVTVND